MSVIPLCAKERTSAEIVSEKWADRVSRKNMSMQVQHETPGLHTSDVSIHNMLSDLVRACKLYNLYVHVCNHGFVCKLCYVLGMVSRDLI